MEYKGSFVFSAQELYDMAENKRKEEKEKRLEKAYAWTKEAIREYCLPNAKTGYTEVALTLTDEIKTCMPEVREILEVLGYKVTPKDRYTFMVSWRK